MDGFVKCFAKFAVVLSVGLAVILLIVAGLLIFKPMFLLKVLYYGIILVCLIGAVRIIVSLIGCLLQVLKK